MNGEVSEVGLIADELSRAVELTLNPSVAQESRLQAYNACESFKENSPWCAQAGLLLASGNQYSAVVKHFGLQLMEHTVKYRWTQITQAEKIFIKENAMKLLYMGGWETGHLNDALARVVVEMVKREWPQQWPTLLAELSDACAQGHQHTQIVLHIFLRLVEDVATLQTLEQNQRRKDIYQALTSNMAEIFGFFMRLIELHVQEFREKTAAGDYSAAASNERVVQVVLLTLSGFVEWVSTSHIVMNNGRLLQILCILLQDDAFRLPAADCLLQIVNRKGATKEKKPLLILFSEDAISCIHRAAMSCMNSVDERQYLFLKRLAQVVAGLGSLLTSMWSCCTNVEGWLGGLVSTLASLTSHPSPSVSHLATSVWSAFFRHDQLSRHAAVQDAVPRWLCDTAPKLLKVNYPTSRVSGSYEAVTFVCMDYDSEQEFNAFFARFRMELLDSYRHCMSVAPLVTWGYVERWIEAVLDAAETHPETIDVTHHVYHEWEALSMMCEVVLSRVVCVSPRPPPSAGLVLLRRCVSTSPASPLLLSLLLSLLSALFVFLSCAYSQLAGPAVGSAGAELLPRVIDKVYGCVRYRVHDRSRNIYNVRKHAANLLVKLAMKYPLLLLGVYSHMSSLTRAALEDNALSAGEMVTLQEALLLVSNHFNSYDRQAALVTQVIGTVLDKWSSLSGSLSSPEGVCRVVGLHPPTSPTDPTAAAHRRDIQHALTLLLGVVRRTQVPDDPDKATRGGFQCGTSPSGNPVWRHPAAPALLPLLPSVVSLCRSLHGVAREPPAPALLALPLPEHRALLGLTKDDLQSDTSHTIQTFLHTVHENICLIIGAAASNLGREFYAVPGLSGALVESLLHNLPHLPDHWLRPIIRNALRPLLHHCPTAHYHDIAIPILDHFAPFMLSHLRGRWEYIGRLYESGALEEGATDAQEVLDDMLVRHLSREYIELIKICLVGGPLAPEGASEMEEEGGGGGGAARAPEVVSELGGALLAHPPAGPALLHTLYGAVGGPDSHTSLRATIVIPPAVRHLTQTSGASEVDVLGSLVALLSALRPHGQHESNQAALLAAALYVLEALRPGPLYPAALDVLAAIPDVDLHDVQRLDERLAADKPAKHDKGKRDLFKKITSKLIGRNVGQLFKKEVLIMNLPQLPVAPRDKGRSALDTPGDPGLTGLFTQAHT